MATKPRTKAKRLATNYPVPQDRSECENAIRELGDKRREVARIEADMNDRLAKIKQEFEAKAAPLKDRVAELLGGIETYCAANRDALTNTGKTKTHAFGSGEVKWRTRPPRVSVRGQDDVLEALKGLGLGRFIRTSETVNKEAILDEPDTVKGIKGITVGSEGEDFVVEPFEQKISKGGAA
ncbi:MAG: host-nuclease inhibitor Gam family protein [Roseitalea sp.]|nr:host-nuclease inhibitor Gam family protein [Roseitalea sp.]MBO6951006.1 host-nuclease inhibitor Gam family protein [Rhizobiaceae bacterium]MBO6591007.1 host-nuclease inhibitor Gam family protein [Roseitalea sp.]MBO6599735.1 host-nuclease inhibitor Gam family protein [Roseitalea sp.]MBO6611491.1 host-nuclease inhibitor Gam family protein [Roseitalea sp.]